MRRKGAPFFASQSLRDHVSSVNQELREEHRVNLNQSRVWSAEEVREWICFKDFLHKLQITHPTALWDFRHELFKEAGADWTHVVRHINDPCLEGSPFANRLNTCIPAVVADPLHCFNSLTAFASLSRTAPSLR